MGILTRACFMSSNDPLVTRVYVSGRFGQQNPSLVILGKTQVFDRKLSRCCRIYLPDQTVELGYEILDTCSSVC